MNDTRSTRRSVLREKRPMILCEVGGDRAEPVAAILREAGYQLFDWRANPADRKPLDVAVWDTLAIPAEKTADIQRVTSI